MSKVTCDVIRDLLPLYHDGVCSGDSGELVEEHLRSCVSCREELRAMEETPAPEIETDRALEAVGRAWDMAKKRSFRRGLAIGGEIFLGIALVIGVFFSFFAVRRMEGASMAPTLSHGEVCVFSRLSEPRRGDIAAIRVDWLGVHDVTDIVRVAAVPGDVVTVENGTLFINGEASEYYPAGGVDPGDVSYPVVLEDEYFVVGDDPANSLDSRYRRYGTVSGESVIGVYIGNSTPAAEAKAAG